jgi:P27 family predicted phage terminase small subunit
VAADPIALAAWERAVTGLQALDLWHRADRDVVTRYALMWSTWEACRRDVAANGLTMETRTGYRAPSPTATLMSKIAPQLLTLEVAMGFTARARARMRITAPNRVDDKLSKFIRGEELTDDELEELARDD